MIKLLRSLPHFPGKNRLVNLLYHRTIRNAKNLLVKGKYGCSYLLPNLTESVTREIFINGIYEQEVSKFILTRLAKDSVLLDVGANIGAITIPVKKQRPDVEIICVEAMPWVFEYLQKNLATNRLSVNTIAKAVFDTDNLELDFYSPAAEFGKGSLSPVFTNEAVKVSTISLDSISKQLHVKPDFVKVDVEGYEYYVFKGGSKMLSGDGAPDILFEFVDWAEERAAGISKGAAQELLLQYGYSIYNIAPIGELTPIPGVIYSGSTMLFATKNEI